MKLKATVIAIAALISGIANASDMFTINQAQTATGTPTTEKQITSPVLANKASNNLVVPQVATMDEYSELVRNTVATKTMTLYNFKSLRQETFQYKQIDTDIEYARTFLPPTEGVHDIFNYYVENDVSPGLALLLTYKKLDETLKSMNQK